MGNSSIDERKRVAKRLRYAASDGTANVTSTLKHVLRLGASDTYRDAFRRLADLIDPDGEVER